MVVEEVGEGVGERKDDSGGSTDRESVIYGESTLGNVSAPGGAEPLHEEAIPRVGRTLTDDFGMKVEQGGSDVGAPDARSTSSPFVDFFEGEAMKPSFDEEVDESFISLRAVIAKPTEKLLKRVGRVRGHEVRQDVNTAGNTGTVRALTGKLGVD
jgi:hypothetical protein